jgi:protein-L-isoaspartate(D-aspartate) O-methyltransferase
MLDTVDDTAFTQSRHEMVERQVISRGVRDPNVLKAMRAVPREEFLLQSLREFAYDDAPLPIDANQTISQPYIVAFMAEALNLKGGEAILEIGTGSGYAAAVLSRIAAHVYTVERIAQLAEKAAIVLADLHYDNVLVRHGDGTQGWPEHAPYDAIIVAAGGPTVPEALKQQLKIGGRLVIPVGKDQHIQELVRVTRLSEKDYKTEDIADVRFVPLIGKEGWLPKEGEMEPRQPAREIPRKSEDNLAKTVAAASTPFPSVESEQEAPKECFGNTIAGISS